jgi:hypothetical protein
MHAPPAFDENESGRFRSRASSEVSDGTAVFGMAINHATSNQLCRRVLVDPQCR